MTECHFCAADAIDDHHVVPQRLGADDDSTVPVCKECHNKVHGLVDPVIDHLQGVNRELDRPPLFKLAQYQYEFQSTYERLQDRGEVLHGSFIGELDDRGVPEELAYKFLRVLENSGLATLDRRDDVTFLVSEV